MRGIALPLASLALALLLGACGSTEPTGDTSDAASSIESALEQENGGLAMADEQPAFGEDRDLLPDLDEVEIEENLELPELPGELDALEGKAPMPLPPPPPPCPHGLLKGRWKPIKPGLGVFWGKWGNPRKPLGHLKGIYGKNKKGHGVFFGKYIGLHGKFMGILAGRYENGFYKGRWFDKHGLRGELHGVYGKGVFVGKWHAFCPRCVVRCEPGFAPGAPDPASTNAKPDAAGSNDPSTTPDAAGGVGAPMPDPERCLCLPPKIIPCKMGKCPGDLVCNPCPPICKPGVPCPAVCGPPVCVPKPPLPPKPNAAGELPLS
jgi:hypothetical protein